MGGCGFEGLDVETAARENVLLPASLLKEVSYKTFVLDFDLPTPCPQHTAVGRCCNSHLRNSLQVSWRFKK